MRVASRTLVRLGAAPVVDVAMRDGMTMRLDVRSRTESGALWNGDLWDPEVRFLASLLERGSVVLDIGANVGLVTLPLATRLRDLGAGRVLAVEPIPVNVERLRRTIDMNSLRDVVDVFPIALSELPGTIEMTKEGGFGESANAMVVLAGRNGSRVSDVVDCMPLDTLARHAGLDRLDLVKIDVEGFELPVLRGGVNVLRKQRPVVYGEFHNILMPLRGYNFVDVWRLFASMDYRCHAFDREGALVAIEEPEPGRGNVALIPREKVAAVEASYRAAVLLG